MEPGYSIFNPGVGSLNFELSTHANEEDEAAEEEKIKEKELQDLLTNAFDDLIDDDDDEGSIQHDSPTQNSMHSEANSSSGTNFIKLPYQNDYVQHNNNDNCNMVKLALQSPYDLLQARHNIAEETNGKFQQMDPDTIGSEISADGSSREFSQGEQQLNKDWEGQYYVDQWGDGHSDDQLQSGLLDTHVVNGLQNRHMESGKTNGYLNEDSNSIIPHQPYYVELNRQNNAEYKQPIMTNNEALHKQFLTPGGDSSDQIKLQQLQILYNARGREIQRLQQNLETMREEMNTDAENMKQHLTAMNNENGIYSASLQANQRQLDSLKDSVSKLEGQLRATEIQLVSVTSNRNEVVQKLQVAESAIESLQVQIEEFQKSENLNRARQNHAAMMLSMKEKHNQEIYRLKEEIDEVREGLSNKEDEVEKLKESLKKISQECEEVKMEKAESVNRLLKALEESQKECQKLVHEAKEISSIPSQLHLNAEINDNLVQTLKDELAITKQELELYISTARFEDATNGQSNGNKHVSSSTNDNLLTTLKSEVERSLICLQNKNEQLRKLQTNYQASQTKIQNLQEVLNTTKNSYLQSQVKTTELIKELHSVKENLMANEKSSEVDALKSENNSLKSGLQRSKAHAEELSGSIEKLNNEICQLNDRIADLKEAHEQEKRKAVNDCRDACLQLHNDATRVNRDEMEERLTQIQSNHLQQVEAITHELNEVKGLYVKVCEEKNQLENDLLKEWNEEKAMEIQRLERNWATEMEKKMNLMKEDFAKKLNQNRKHRQGSSEEDFITRVRIEVTKQTEERLRQAKILWAREQELLVEEKASVKAREMVQAHASSKLHQNSNGKIDEYLEQIQELEKRVKQTEELYKMELSNLETQMNLKKTEELNKLEERLIEEMSAKMRNILMQKNEEMKSVIKDMEIKFHTEKQQLLNELKTANNSNMVEKFKKQLETVDKATKHQFSELVGKIEDEKSKVVKAAIATAEEERRRALVEIELKKELLLQEKLQTLTKQKDKEKEEALKEMELKLCAELETFVAVQKNRYFNALKSMQESHAKEKDELLSNYETKISLLREEYKKSMESQNLERQVHKEQVQISAKEEMDRLQETIKTLENKGKQVESEMLIVINGLKNQLRIKEDELEEMTRKLDEDRAKSSKTQDDNDIFQTLKNEVSSLKALVTKAQDEADLYRLKAEETEASYQNLVSRHSNLKEKVKKYHRHIHGKEKEFAVSLTKITEEHKAALEKVYSMKSEVIMLVDKRLEELRRHLFEALANTEIPEFQSTNEMRTESQKYTNNLKKGINADVKPNAENGIADLKENFAESVRKVHADIMSYLEECNHFATAKIQEEVAKASWLLSEQLGITPTTAKKKSSLRETPVMSHDNVTPIESRPRTPELFNNFSSGRGTMVGNPSSLSGAIETVRHAETQTSTKEEICVENISKPVKFWSSTPFAREFIQPSPDCPKPNSLLNNPSATRTIFHGKDVAYDRVSKDKPPFSKFLSTISAPGLTFSNVTWKSTDNCMPPEDCTFPEKLPFGSKTTKLRSLAHQILSQSAVQDSPGTMERPESDNRKGSEERKSRFIAFNDNLSLLKTDFWHGINGTTESKQREFKS